MLRQKPQTDKSRRQPADQREPTQQFDHARDPIFEHAAYEMVLQENLQRLRLSRGRLAAFLHRF
jgi:hypothetical protein